MKNAARPRCQFFYQSGKPCRFIGFIKVTNRAGEEKLSCYGHKDQATGHSPERCSYCGDPHHKHPNLICQEFKS